MTPRRALLPLILATLVASFAVSASAEPDDKALARCVEPPADLVGWWPLDDGDGTTALELVDGNFGVHDGAPVPVPGIVDGALSFDGQDDRVVVPDDDLLDVGAGDFSIDAWVRSGAGGVRTIVDKRVDLAPGFPVQPHGYHFFLYNRRPGIQLAIGGTWRNWVATQAVPAGSWAHVAVTVDRDDPAGIQFYIDGLAAGPTQDPTGFSSSVSNDSPLVLGGRSLEAGGLWDGELDEIEVFRRELSLFDVLGLALAGRAGKCKCAAPGCGLVAWWPLDAALFDADDLAGHVSGPHDGEVLGPTPVTGRVASALSFDGVDDRVEVDETGGLGVNLVKPGALSLAAWISADGAAGYRPIVTKTVPHPTDLGTIGYTLYLNHGELGFSFVGFDFETFARDVLIVPCQAAACEDLRDGRWHHVGATLEHDAGGRNVHGHLYLDGRLVGTAGPVDLPPDSGGGRLLIGAEFFRPSHFFEGRIDEVQVYDRALLEEDFAALYGAGDEGLCTERPAISCGSRGLPPCSGAMFCDFGAGTGCGATDIGGVCRVRPEVCPLDEDPVCGCNGMTYPNECAAHQDGVSVAFPGPC